jgi:hypothetical protein
MEKFESIHQPEKINNKDELTPEKHQESQKNTEQLLNSIETIAKSKEELSRVAEKLSRELDNIETEISLILSDEKLDDEKRQQIETILEKIKEERKIFENNVSEIKEF